MNCRLFVSRSPRRNCDAEHNMSISGELLNSLPMLTIERENY